MIRSEEAKIVSMKRLGRAHVRMRLAAPRIAENSLPGQFVNVRCAALDYPQRVFESPEMLSDARECRCDEQKALLMRPFAVHRAWAEGANAGQIEILFKVVGKGTRALAERKVGETVPLLGPLGKGFDLEFARRLSTAVIVAGGVGVAPVYPLAAFLRRHHVHTLVIVGVLSADDMPIEGADSRVTLSFMAERPEVVLTAREFEELGCVVGVVTFHGTKGYVGLPTEMADRFLHFTEGGARGEAGIFTCGPWGMMREVAYHAEEHDVRCQVLLEERMGCGIGACMACICKVREGDNVVNKRVCIEGPVFDASEVVWDGN